jgi:hypothetical protein
MTGYGFIRIHDAWMLDGDLGQLMAEGRYDAVCLFFAAIAHAHMHDTDGKITREDRSTLERVCNIADQGAFDALIATSKLVKERGGRGGTVLRIRAYDRWQITRDQRESNADRMREARARAAPRASKRRERRGNVHADGDARSPDAVSGSTPDGAGPDVEQDADAFAEEAFLAASRRIAELEAGTA